MSFFFRHRQNIVYSSVDSASSAQNALLGSDSESNASSDMESLFNSNMEFQEKSYKKMNLLNQEKILMQQLGDAAMKVLKAVSV